MRYFKVSFQFFRFVFVKQIKKLISFALHLYLQVNRTTLRTKVAIPETIRQDKGNYKLVAENCFAKAQHVIRVEILGNIII